jgi:hypothetical protein
MKILSIQLLLLTLLSVSLNAEDIEILVQKLKLSPASKAIVQWERVFKSDRKMKRYKINNLTMKEKKKLEEYLINHAIDSDMPTVAGEY